MNRTEFEKLLKSKIMVLDGAYGTEFFKKGLGNIPGELLNLKHPKVVEELQRSYVNAGADILLSNTFSANRLKLKSLGLEKEIVSINIKAVQIAKKASAGKAFVFGDISSSGEFPFPIGKVDFEELVENFKEQTAILLNAGVDGFIVETMSDLKELKAAILGIRAITVDLPLIVHMTFDETKRSVTGTSAAIFASWADDLDVDCIGINCTLGPKESIAVFKEISLHTSKPLSVEPNAGMPNLDNGKLTYSTTPEDFALYVEDYIELGANIIGGCCGTTAEHIKMINYFASRRKPIIKRKKTKNYFISSRTQISSLIPFAIIGERINPASRKTFQQFIQNHDFSKVIMEAQQQRQEGAKILDVNLGIEKLLDHSHFKNMILTLDKQSSLPLSIDVQTPKFLETAMREYVGRPIVNSAMAREKHLRRRVDIVKKYGGMLILLAMEKSIENTAEKRFKTAMKGIALAEKYGLSVDRIIVDPLVLSFGAGKDPSVTRKTVELLTEEGILTTVGLSNLSFGMPNRSYLNGVFLAQNIEVGLTSAIMNPADDFVMKSLKAAEILKGNILVEQKEIHTSEIVKIILDSNKKELKSYVQKYLDKGQEPLEISQEILGKAMEEIGRLYSSGDIYLPHLLLAAEVTNPVFEYLNSLSKQEVTYKGKVLLATVEGDVHDIGKKIVGTVLKSNGYEIFDMGKDIEAEKIINKIEEIKPDIVGLSAMMTTTVEQVARVSEMLRTRNIKVFLISGGASMNKKLADQFGCDGYAKKASDAVNLCDNLIKNNKILNK